MTFSRRSSFPQAENRISVLLREKRRSGRLLDLTESNPTKVGLEYPSHWLERLSQPSVLHYEPRPAGLEEATAAVVEYYAERGFQTAASDIFLTASTSEAYSWLFKLLCDPGDQILAPRPGYPLFDHLAAFEGAEVEFYPLRYDGAWHVDLEALARSVSGTTRALICINPNNPTGSYLTEDEWAAMASLCRRHALGLIVDEVFSDFRLDPLEEGGAGRGPAAAATRQPVVSVAGRGDCLSFVLSGLSKVLCLPQMKLGWILIQGPEEEKREAHRRLELIADSFLSVNTPVQHAFRSWIRGRRSIQDQVVVRLRQNLTCLRVLARGTPCEVLGVDGGWYSIVRVPRTRSEEEWVLRMLQEDDLLVHPGYFFDFESEAYLVISLLCRPAEFEEGASRLVRRVCQDAES